MAHEMQIKPKPGTGVAFWYVVLGRDRLLKISSMWHVADPEYINLLNE